MFVKTLAGLRIESDIDLPHVSDFQPGSPCFESVRIRIANSSEGPNPPSRTFTLRLRGIGAFFVPNRSEIIVAPEPQAREAAIAWFVMGPCFAAVAYLNGILPLHAAAIDTPQGCIAFAGKSGSGKSTLAHAFHVQGYAVRSDDVCFIRACQGGEVMVWAGIRLLRLVSANGAGALKQLLPLPPLAEPTQPVRLRAVCVLDSNVAGNEIRIARLAGARATEQVIANAFRARIAARLGLAADLLPRCAKVAAATAVYRFIRPLDFDVLPESLRRLKHHFSAEPC